MSFYKKILKTKGFVEEKKVSKLILESGEILNVRNGDVVIDPKNNEFVSHGAFIREIKV